MKEKEKQISHFSHPGQSTVYTCDLCKIQARKIRFRCTTCPDFNLDLVYASCELDTTSFMHPDHNLGFLISPESVVDCAVCNQGIDGGHYTCCDFYVHPLCTKFPEIIKAGLSPAHEDHELKGIFSSTLTTCHVCRQDCIGLRYCCEEGCGVYFHPLCLIGFGYRDMKDSGDGAGNSRRSIVALGKTYEVIKLGIEIWELLRRINELCRELNL